MTLEKRFVAWLERFLWRTASGAPRAPLPWDSLWEHERQRLPAFLRTTARLGPPLVIAGPTLAVLGWLASVGALFGVGLGLGVVAARAYRQAWKRAGEIAAQADVAAERVHEDEDVVVELTLRNDGRRAIPRVIAYAVFDGAATAEVYAIEGGIAPRARRTVRLAWKADRGMGRFALHSLRLVVADDLGLFPMCVAPAFAEAITVEPEARVLEDFPLRQIGLATDAGAFETRLPGESVSFRGLRPWRVGDGMRRIDWKRSQRAGHLLVKELDRIASTDATILLDLSNEGQGRYGTLSTFDALKGAALDLARWLAAQRIGTRFVAEGVELPRGAGRAHDELLSDMVRDLTPRSGVSLAQTLAARAADIEPDTFLALFACAGNVQLEDLWETLVLLDERRVEIALVLVDTSQYLKAIRQRIGIAAEDVQAVAGLVAEASRKDARALSGLAAKLLGRTYVLGPETTLADAAAGVAGAAGTGGRA